MISDTELDEEWGQVTLCRTHVSVARPFIMGLVLPEDPDIVRKSLFQIGGNDGGNSPRCKSIYSL